MAMQAGDIMSREFIAVGATAPIQEVVGFMIKKQEPYALVLDDERRPIGIVTEADLLKILSPGSVRFLDMVVCLDRGVCNRDMLLKQLSVNQVMTRPVQCVGTDMPIERVLAAMLEKRLDQLPVLENGLVTGVLRRSDLIRSLYRSGRELEEGDKEN
jgi:CBS domain-containing protein